MDAAAKVIPRHTTSKSRFAAGEQHETDLHNRNVAGCAWDQGSESGSAAPDH
jgi:hypothetical protein